MVCEHKTIMQREVLVMVASVLGLVILREFLTWFLRLNVVVVAPA